ncbi:36469_t:CDS:2, partial [Racocetra persica]
DKSNYEALLANENVIKYLYQEKPLVDKKFEDKTRFIISKPEEKEGRSEIAYALSSKYWNKGIGQSVLSKIVEVWGPEVCKELEQFRATVRPINISSWNILEKAGFEPVQADISINFEDKEDKS